MLQLIFCLTMNQILCLKIGVKHLMFELKLLWIQLVNGILWGFHVNLMYIFANKCKYGLQMVTLYLLMTSEVKWVNN